MKYTEKMVEMLMTADEHTLWDNFTAVCKENGLSEELEQVRFGIKHKFEIEDLLEGNFVPKLKNGYYSFIKGGITIPVTDVRTEMIERKYLMRKVLLESMENEDPLEAR